MKLFSLSSVLALFVLVSFPAFSNNILVENVSLEDQLAAEHYVYIEFDLSWDNSWRTSSVPNNWDAAWIFCKYRVAGGAWYHVKLHNTSYTAPTGATLEIAGDTTGAFIYRDANGSGSNNFDNIRFRWNYGLQGVNDDAALEVKVFAIEMVYVPESSFFLGDSTSSPRFYTYSNNKTFYNVTSENAISCGNTNGYLWSVGGNISTGTIPAAYPKGFQSFYMMKYELSQEQYVEFLNTLTRDQQNTRTQATVSGISPSFQYVMTNVSGIQNRNGIFCESTLPATGPVTFYCNYDYVVPPSPDVLNNYNDGQNIACNYISWPDLAAYLDWSGLRPMTEMEYEKSCRGPNNPVGGEYAWGNSLIYASPYTYTNIGEASEAFTSLPQNTGNCLYNATWPSSNWYVARCGIFAASSVNHNRMETGATYYGIMEMSGLPAELVVNAYDDAGWSFTGLHGNGTLLASGDADVAYWPGMDGNTTEATPNGTTGGVTGYAGAGVKGSDLSLGASGLTISVRNYVVGLSWNNRASWYGGRGCRTAP